MLWHAVDLRTEPCEACGIREPDGTIIGGHVEFVRAVELGKLIEPTPSLVTRPTKVMIGRCAEHAPAATGSQGRCRHAEQCPNVHTPGS